jgi:hypothetical protein
MFQVYLFYFCVLLSLSCWPRRGLGTTASNNIIFLDASSIQKNYYWTLSTSAAEIYHDSAAKISLKFFIRRIYYHLRPTLRRADINQL